MAILETSLYFQSKARYSTHEITVTTTVTRLHLSSVHRVHESSNSIVGVYSYLEAWENWTLVDT